MLIGVGSLSWAGGDHDRARQATEAGEVLPAPFWNGSSSSGNHPGQVLVWSWTW